MEEINTDYNSSEKKWSARNRMLLLMAVVTVGGIISAFLLIYAIQILRYFANGV